jgi:5-oxopent-3-ene-1,2,5-tricarboxylate decarboxylase / 2-hydroxyhepta-2,4-diene-1,7-dioate isomerase
VTADQYDPHDATCRVSINGQVRSVTTTGDMVWKLPAVIEWLSRDTTLYPGDVIATGTSEALPIAVGDDVVIEFDGLGRLSNRVVAGWS